MTSETVVRLKKKLQQQRTLLIKQFGIKNEKLLRKLLLTRCERKIIRECKQKRAIRQTVPDRLRQLKEEQDKQLRDETRALNAADCNHKTFLKGTQSANPQNDYSLHFVNAGVRPQNMIHDTGLANRFEEYPKLRELVRLKDELIANTNSPPMYLKCDLTAFDLTELDCKFDVILVEPPLEEYRRMAGCHFERYWSWDEVEKLDIAKLAAPRAFIWMWVGSGEGLDRGRDILRRWGFRRCEDICWVKTNLKNPVNNKYVEPGAVFQRTKEHCLMGIKGTVRRSVDTDFIHSNIDIDLIIEEEPPPATKEKPTEIFHIMEHFCLGRRRLHIFGRDSTIRPGWLTIGPEVTSSNFEVEKYKAFFKQSHLTGCTEEVERLRPKSPPPKGSQATGSSGAAQPLAAGAAGAAGQVGQVGPSGPAGAVGTSGPQSQPVQLQHATLPVALMSSAASPSTHPHADYDADFALANPALSYHYPQPQATLLYDSDPYYRGLPSTYSSEFFYR